MKPMQFLVLLLALSACERSDTVDAKESAVSVPPSVTAAGPVTDSGAVALVQEYVARDGRGERLGVSQWFRDAVDWPDEPGYDEITVISGYEVGTANVVSDTARIPVRFRRIGRIETDENSARFVSDTGQEAQQFVVERRETRWIIVEPQINQHVLAERVLALISLAEAEREALRRLGTSP